MSLMDTPCFLAAVVAANLVEWAENMSVFTPDLDNTSFIHRAIVAGPTALCGFRNDTKSRHLPSFPSLLTLLVWCK